MYYSITKFVCSSYCTCVLLRKDAPEQMLTIGYNNRLVRTASVSLPPHGLAPLFVQAIISETPYPYAKFLLQHKICDYMPLQFYSQLLNWLFTFNGWRVERGQNGPLVRLDWLLIWAKSQGKTLCYEGLGDRPRSSLVVGCMYMYVQTNETVVTQFLPQFGSFYLLHFSAIFSFPFFWTNPVQRLRTLELIPDVAFHVNWTACT